MIYPTFEEIRARQSDTPVFRLLWMAIAKLCTEGKYAKMTPEEVCASIHDTTHKVYDDWPDEITMDTLLGNPTPESRDPKTIQEFLSKDK